MIWYLIFINVWGCVLCFIDKQKARHHQWRIPEMTFFAVAFIGGTFGILIGMWIAHHKTQKRSFSTPIVVCFLINLVGLYWLL